MVRRVGTFVLPGKIEKTKVCEIVRWQDGPNQDRDKLCLLFEGALLSYVKAARKTKRLQVREKKLAWSRVAAEFEALQAAYSDDGPTRFFKNRALQYSKNPPAWPAWPIRMESSEQDHSQRS